MDSSRFDSVARACAGALSRRHALAALLAGLPLALAAAPETAGKRKHHRDNHKPKRNGDDNDGGDDGAGACYPGTTCEPGRGATNAGCDFGGSSLFRNLNVRGAVLSSANFSGADLSSADLRGAVLRDACLVGADLTDARLDNSTVLGGAIFCQTIMPDTSVDNSGCGQPTACCPTSDPGGAPGGGNPCTGPWRPQTTFGTRGTGPNQLRGPFGVAVSADGQTAWVADTNNDRIAVWTKTGGNWTPQTTFGRNGSGRSQFRDPTGVAAAADRQTVWVADSGNSRIAVWTQGGGEWTPQTTFGSRGSGPDRLDSPQGVAVSADGQTVWVADSRNDRVAVWVRSGETWQPQTTFGVNAAGRSEFSFPHGVAAAADGQTVWVTDNNRVAVWTKTGGSWRSQTTFGSGGDGPDEFRNPHGVAVAADGQTIWVADRNNNRIAVWTTAGGSWRTQRIFGDNGSGQDQFRAPGGVAVSPEGQTFWVADTGNDRIAVWKPACLTS